MSLHYPPPEDTSRSMAAVHSSHPRIIARLKRAEGHIRSIIAMIEGGRPCADLAQQLHAVEAAVANAKRELIHDHIEGCLGQAEGVALMDDLEEIKRLTKYL